MKINTLKSVPKTSLSVPKEPLRQCQTVYRTRVELLCLKVAFVPFCFLFSSLFLFWVVTRISKLLSKEKNILLIFKKLPSVGNYRFFEVS